MYDHPHFNDKKTYLNVLNMCPNAKMIGHRITSIWTFFLKSLYSLQPKQIFKCWAEVSPKCIHLYDI